MRRLMQFGVVLAVAGSVVVGGGDESEETPAPTHSRIRIQAEIVNSTGAIHPKVLNQVLVGILRNGADSSRIQTKASDPMVDTFTLWFDSLVPIGSSVIIDAFIDSDTDGVFDPPANFADGWALWAEPAVRWVLDTVAYDDAGSHGVQLTYQAFTNNKTDISDMP